MKDRRDDLSFLGTRTCGLGKGEAKSDCERQMTGRDKTYTEVWSHYSPVEVVRLLVWTLQRLLTATEGSNHIPGLINHSIHIF